MLDYRAFGANLKASRIEPALIQINAAMHKSTEFQHACWNGRASGRMIAEGSPDSYGTFEKQPDPGKPGAFLLVMTRQSGHTQRCRCQD